VWRVAYNRDRNGIIDSIEVVLIVDAYKIVQQDILTLESDLKKQRSGWRWQGYHSGSGESLQQVPHVQNMRQLQ
jgi:hypothetical protein